MTALSDPGLVVGRLEEIEKDLAELQNEYEDAATDFARAKRDWEKTLAQRQLQAEGPNADTRKADALLKAIERQPVAYENLRLAEGTFLGCKAKYEVLNTRAMIGMAILRAQGRG